MANHTFIYFVFTNQGQVPAESVFWHSSTESTSPCEMHSGSHDRLMCDLLIGQMLCSTSNTQDWLGWWDGLWLVAPQKPLAPAVR